MSAHSVTDSYVATCKPSGTYLFVHIFPQVIFLVVNSQLGLDAAEGEVAHLVAQLAEAPKVQGSL